MEKGFESWLRDQQINRQTTNLNPSSAAFGFRHRLNIPSFGNTISPNMTTGNPPAFAFAASVPEEPCGWFYGLPRYRPVVNSVPKEQLQAAGILPEKQKKFLVFDQSNDRTTVIYSSTPIQCHLPKPESTDDLKKSNPASEKPEGTRFSNPFRDDGNDLRSEMREDTKELNALLYSDDDEIDYSEDEEEQSTGHSPVMITGFDFDRQEWPEENAGEVASSTRANKRHKLENGGYDVVSLEDTASSGKSGEAELSSCGGAASVAGNGLPEVESETGKRSRKEKVRETISILQDLIPGGKNGKDAMMILDEAINYLRILKVKAKAVGLDSL